MRLAHHVIAHKGPAQVARMLRRLDGDGVSFFVQVGPDRSWVSDELSAQLARPNVTILRPRRIRWGRFSLADAVLGGMLEAFASGVRFDYISLDSGQDYPIKPNEQLLVRLEQSSPASFLAHWQIGDGPWERGGGRERYQSWHFGRVTVPNRFLRVPLKRSFPAGLTPYGGSAYATVSRQTVAWIADFVRDRPEVVRFFKRAFFPDELLVPTLIANAPYDVVNDSLRHIRWNPPSAHPELLTTADLPALAESTAFSARKFDADVDAKILDLIDSQLLGVEAPSL